MNERTCKLEGCDRPAGGTANPGSGKGWCPVHYRRYLRHGDPEHGGEVTRQQAAGARCDHCRKPSVARGLCENHYRRWRRYGDPVAGQPARGGSAARRFWRKVTKTESCWLWTDVPNGTGYGTFKVDGVTVMAHRFSWLLAGRALDPDLQLDHLCRVRLCVNPDHLEQVTAAENLARAREAKRGLVGGGSTPV